jgi:Cdc6-like AAA superfamily ATPase
LHEEHTGGWFITSPEYKSWMSGSESFLWLHGIPGAGKTVLVSFIVESVKKFCKNDAPVGTGWAYYYCYFGRAQDETPHILRWVINQLCRQSECIPNEVLELHHAGAQPTIASLVDAFTSLLRHFRRVYLLVDALDESLNRQNLLEMLTGMSRVDLEKLRLLVASRKEGDIERSFENVSAISLSNPRVDEDIRNYIRSQLHSDRRFSYWPEGLKRETEATLVEGAKGM